MADLVTQDGPFGMAQVTITAANGKGTEHVWS
jgi:hypothetical protein